MGGPGRLQAAVNVVRQLLATRTPENYYPMAARLGTESLSEMRCTGSHPGMAMTMEDAVVRARTRCRDHAGNRGLWHRT